MKHMAAFALTFPELLSTLRTHRQGNLQANVNVIQQMLFVVLQLS